MVLPCDARPTEPQPTQRLGLELPRCSIPLS
jgi:hypothetical protein